MKDFFTFRSSKSRMVALCFVDILAIASISYLSLLLRFMEDSWELPRYMPGIHRYVLINVITTLVIFLVLNLYNRVWSYASVHEVVTIVGASILSTALQAHPKPQRLLQMYCGIGAWRWNALV